MNRKIHFVLLFFRLSRQNEMIANAYRTVAETEEVGLEITSELARNREKIESSRAKVMFNQLHPPWTILYLILL
jgi:hypothetical protein